jgi:predicted nucleic acid-binding protein
MSTESEGIFIDTNILIYSTFPDFDSEKHSQSLESLNQLLQSGKPLFVSSQILREYFAISTNGSIFKKPLSRKQAVGKIQEFLKRFNLLLEKETTIQTLMDLIEKYAVSRQKIHDLNIAAILNIISIPSTASKTDALFLMSPIVISQPSSCKNL